MVLILERTNIMKKILIFILAAVMLATMSVTAFAEPGSFVISPSKNKAPVIIEISNGSHECTAKLVITPYADRATLNDEKRTAIEGAYDQIVETDDLTTFNASFAKYVKDNGYVAEDLAVSDLFDVSYYACDLHNEHGAFTITLQADTLSGFVGLLHLHNGEWQYIDNAKVDGDMVTFTVDDLSPFAIVVDTNGHKPPVTGDSFNWWIYVALMIVSAASLAVVGYKLKKCED